MDCPDRAGNWLLKPRVKQTVLVRAKARDSDATIYDAA